MMYADPAMNTRIQTVVEVGKKRYKTERMLLGDLVLKLHMHPDFSRYLAKKIKKNGQMVYFPLANKKIMYVVRDEPGMDLKAFVRNNF